MRHLGKAWLAKAREWQKRAKLSGTISYYDDRDEDDEMMIMTKMMIRAMRMMRWQWGDDHDHHDDVEKNAKLFGTIFFMLNIMPMIS